jgi:hypothetical protein
MRQYSLVPLLCRVQQLMQEINRVRMRHAKEDAAKLKVRRTAYCTLLLFLAR